VSVVEPESGGVHQHGPVVGVLTGEEILHLCCLPRKSAYSVNGKTTIYNTMAQLNLII